MKYKVLFGFEAEDYIPIDEKELERAIYAHMTQKNAAFENGSVSGTRIVAIQPDYHAEMGWNRGHVLGPDDFDELRSKGIDEAHRAFQISAKERVQYLMETKQEHLIGKHVPLPELEASPKHQVSTATAALAGKFKV